MREKRKYPFNLLRAVVPSRAGKRKKSKIVERKDGPLQPFNKERDALCLPSSRVMKRFICRPVRLFLRPPLSTAVDYVIKRADTRVSRRIYRVPPVTLRMER